MTNFHKGKAWLERADKKEFIPGGAVYQAMTLGRAGTKVAEAKVTQIPSIDIDGLPWPLSVPWSGSFLTSANPARDFPAHGIFADIEMEIVRTYRQRMIESSADIALLRGEIEALFREFYPNFQFADGIATPLEFNDEEFQDLDTLLIEEKLKASHSKYVNQVEEIIKFCAKQSVLLAKPSGENDSARVRDRFDKFIRASFLLFKRIN